MVMIKTLLWNKYADPSMNLLNKEKLFTGEQATGMLKMFSMHSDFVKLTTFTSQSVLKINTICLLEKTLNMNTKNYLKNITMV